MNLATADGLRGRSTSLAGVLAFVVGRVSREGVMRTGMVAALAAGLVILASSARADACGELWFARNSIYKAGGYCFKTGRAIQAFGNAGCQYDDVRDVPLSFRDRRRVDDIVRDEAAMGCRD